MWGQIKLGSRVLLNAKKYAWDNSPPGIAYGIDVADHHGIGVVVGMVQDPPTNPDFILLVIFEGVEYIKNEMEQYTIGTKEGRVRVTQIHKQDVLYVDDCTREELLTHTSPAV